VIRPILAAAVLLTVSAPAAAQQIPGPYGPSVTLEQARGIVAAGRAEARRQDFLMAFAVVDPSGDLVMFEKMDGTQTASVDVAADKARSAAAFRRPTKAFADSVASGRVAVLSLRGVVAIEGGAPIVSGGRVIGALGVSGGTSEQDGQVAAVALQGVR
jgi:uncharacterized protein GlcG (DUF336 family)